MEIGAETTKIITIKETALAKPSLQRSSKIQGYFFGILFLPCGYLESIICNKFKTFIWVHDWYFLYKKAFVIVSVCNTCLSFSPLNFCILSNNTWYIAENIHYTLAGISIIFTCKMILSVYILLHPIINLV